MIHYFGHDWTQFSVFGQVTVNLPNIVAGQSRDKRAMSDKVLHSQVVSLRCVDTSFTHTPNLKIVSRDLRYDEN